MALAEYSLLFSEIYLSSFIKFSWDCLTRFLILNHDSKIKTKPKIQLFINHRHSNRDFYIVVINHVVYFLVLGEDQ